jgi:hypothetical protein
MTLAPHERATPMTATEAQRAALLHRLMARSVRTPSGCLVWVGACSPGGYGRMGLGSHSVIYVHRARWLAEHGELLPGYLILHSCDNPPCIEITHLRAGTPAENTQDMLDRGRGWQPGMPGPAQVGSANLHSRLTEEMVLSIRRRVAAGETRASVAREVGVSRQTVSDIAARRLWRHLE